MDAPGAGRLTTGERPDADRAAEELRRAGRRVTRPRLAVHAALRELGGHRSADEVAEHLHRAGERMSRTSVYNALEALQAAGLVMMADVGPGRARFEAAEVWHHHFVCRRCGRVIDVPCAVGARPCLAADLPGVEVDEAQVVFRGLCHQCRGGSATP